MLGQSAFTDIWGHELKGDTIATYLASHSFFSAPKCREINRRETLRLKTIPPSLSQPPVRPRPRAQPPSGCDQMHGSTVEPTASLLFSAPDRTWGSHLLIFSPPHTLIRERMRILETERAACSRSSWQPLRALQREEMVASHVGGTEIVG